MTKPSATRPPPAPRPSAPTAAEARTDQARADAAQAREQADRELAQVRADADRQRTELRQALDAQITSLTQARDDLRARAERAETDLDAARAAPGPADPTRPGREPHRATQPPQDHPGILTGHPAPISMHTPTRETMDEAGGPARRPTAAHDASPAAGHDASPAAGHDGSGRVCVWCRGPIPARARRDAVCCSVRCRQARHRFLRTIGRAEQAGAFRPLRLAYADPPYPGRASLYRDHPDYGGEVDHAALFAQLAGYDGWALSTSAEALPQVLALCPPGVRVAAWHRGARPAPGPLATARLGTRPVLRGPPGQPSPGRDTTR